jgi:hypothetical protein
VCARRAALRSGCGVFEVAVDLCGRREGHALRARAVITGAAAVALAASPVVVLAASLVALALSGDCSRCRCAAAGWRRRQAQWVCAARACQWRSVAGCALVKTHTRARAQHRHAQHATPDECARHAHQRPLVHHVQLRHSLAVCTRLAPAGLPRWWS